MPLFAVLIVAFCGGFIICNISCMALVNKHDAYNSHLMITSLMLYDLAPQSASEMTYIVSSGALNSTHSLTSEPQVNTIPKY